MATEDQIDQASKRKMTEVMAANQASITKAVTEHYLQPGIDSLRKTYDDEVKSTPALAETYWPRNTRQKATLIDYKPVSTRWNSSSPRSVQGMIFRKSSLIYQTAATNLRKIHENPPHLATMYHCAAYRHRSSSPQYRYMLHIPETCTSL